MATSEITDDYERVNWVNKGVGSTPLNGSTSASGTFTDGNLNKMDYALKQHSTRLADLYNNKAETDNVPFAFGVDSDGNYGYIKSGETSVTPFKNPTGDVKISSVGTTDVTNYATATTDGLMVTPTASKDITANGTYDITDYASAVVNVPGETPTGTLTINAEGTFDCSEYADVTTGDNLKYVNLVGTSLEISSTEPFTYDATHDSKIDITTEGLMETPTATKEITISSVGTTTEKVTNYAKAQITTSGLIVTPTETLTLTDVSVGTDCTNYAKVKTAGLMKVPTDSQSITENGTYDVTNYASAVVNVSGGTPTGTFNLNGDNFTYDPIDVSNYADLQIDEESVVAPSYIVETKGKTYPLSTTDTTIDGGTYLKTGATIKGVTGGSLDITANGTYDVLNYSNAVVDVPSGQSTARGTFSTITTGKTTVNCGFKPDYILTSLKNSTRVSMSIYDAEESESNVTCISGNTATTLSIGNSTNNCISDITDTGFTVNKGGSAGNTMYWVAFTIDETATVSLEQ